MSEKEKNNKKYLSYKRLFRGRISRKGFFLSWVLLLILALLLPVLAQLFSIISSYLGGIFLLVVSLFLLLVIIPVLWSLYVRRFHDLGHSGWYILLMSIPLLGIFVLIYLFFKKGEPEDNVYGPPQSFDIKNIFKAIINDY